MRIIGIGGAARAGKTTLADILVELINTSGGDEVATTAAFAYPLKSALACLGITKEYKPELYRKAAQQVGTDMLRDPDYCPPYTGPLFHVNRAEEIFLEGAKADKASYEHCLENNTNWMEKYIILDDVRFPEEIDLVRRWSGLMLYVDGGEAAEERQREEGIDMSHSSEAMAVGYSQGVEPDDLFDLTITNFGTVGGLRERIADRLDFFLTMDYLDGAAVDMLWGEG